MARSKDKSSTENLKSIIRKQKKTIEELRKQAGRGNKVVSQLEDRELELAEALLEEGLADERVEDNSSCPTCGKGKLEQIDIGVRKLIVCNSCNFRQVRK